MLLKLARIARLLLMVFVTLLIILMRVCVLFLTSLFKIKLILSLLRTLHLKLRFLKIYKMLISLSNFPPKPLPLTS
nr:MAG TPA: hypothetical protein [Caudoviricetes sp.]